MQQVRESTIEQGFIDKYLVQMPVIREEHQKIADCIASVDKLITAQAKKIDLLRQHKRGLMPQLFPVLEATA